MKIQGFIQVHMIFHKKCLIFPLCVITLFCQYLFPVYAESERQEVIHKKVDYSTFNPDVLKKEADAFFVSAFDSDNEHLKQHYYEIALKKYFIISQIYPADYYSYVQMARIHDNMANSKLAKKYYHIAINLDKYNPYSNFYFGEYHFKRNLYYKALKYYLIAYNNGYENNFVTNLKLAELYEKLGDLKKSKELYLKSYSLNSDSLVIKEKIQSLEALNYEQTEYYHLIRE